MHHIIEKRKMNINEHKKYILIEIISNHYNIDCNYKLKCTNCANIIELGNTLFGKIIIIEKKNADLDCVFKWIMYREKKNKIYNIISKPYYINV